ncbi:transmembrane protein 68-like [Heteronotia binoei]|uniref:transmembrane protein 68-like n=1 Tax=Heteronotia binoei TaxID=13085 RepID=UPI00293090A4|nr:transmembrane protein 68-like [Heteronotia binoei]XP_060099771.1 transmembrane protein 68-like [Heteronotia binoei]
MINPTDLTYTFEEWTGAKYVQEYFLLGLSWLLTALLAVPLWILCYMYLSALIVQIFDKTSQLTENSSNKLQRICILVLAHLWDIFGKIWHGYELHGLENVPDGPALVIYYHAALPVDYIFFISRLFLQKKIFCRTVVDRFVFKLPGYRRLLEALRMFTGMKKDCLTLLKDGHLVSISPGGSREALFSDDTYKIMWCNRTGFAQVAIDAKVPIIPMFTQNVREAYKTLGDIRVLKRLYEYSRWPLSPVYGGFPVKLRTYLGEPIPYDSNITAEELAEKTKIAIQDLIYKHQKLPANTVRALLERFDGKSKED